MLLTVGNPEENIVYSSDISDSSDEDPFEEEQLFTLQEFHIFEETPINTNIVEWPTLNESYPNGTVIFSFGEN